MLFFFFILKSGLRVQYKCPTGLRDDKSLYNGRAQCLFIHHCVCIIDANYSPMNQVINVMYETINILEVFFI